MSQFFTGRGGATRSFNPFLGPGQGLRSGPTTLGRQQVERPARAIGRAGRALGKNPLSGALHLMRLMHHLLRVRLILSTSIRVAILMSRRWMICLEIIQMSSRNKSKEECRVHLLFFLIYLHQIFHH